MTENTNPTSRAQIRSVVGFLIFIELASGFTQGYYPPLLSDFARHLEVTDANITWFLAVQMLAAAVFVPLLSKLGDMFGHRLILRIAIVATLVGTLITALVPSYGMVLLGRVLAGPQAVWLPLEIAIIHNKLTGVPARRAIGMLVSFLTGGAIIGTLAAGLVAAVSPSIVVTMLVPPLLVLVAVWAAFTKIPETTTRAEAHIDWVGFAGIGAFMILLLLGLNLVGTVGLSPLAVGLLAAGSVVLVVWIFWELRTRYPAVDVRLVGSRRVGPIYLAALAFGMVMFGGQAPIATFLGSDPKVTGFGFDAPPALISAVIGAVTILATIGAATFSYIAAKIGMKAVILAGAALSGIGNFMLIPLHTSLVGYFASAIVMGLGFGLLLGALPARLADLAPRDSTGIATGVYNSLRTLGGALAGAVFAAMLGAAIIPGTDSSSLTGYMGVWIFSGAVFVIAFVALWFLPGDGVGAGEGGTEPELVDPNLSE